MTISTKVPPFGDFVNAAIQLMKSDRAKKIQITKQVVKKYIDDDLSITEEIKKINYLSEFWMISDGGEIKEYYQSCYESIIDLLPLILQSIELIENDVYPLKTTYDKQKVKFEKLNERITPDIFQKLDPHNMTVMRINANNILYGSDYTFENITNFKKLRDCLLEKERRLLSVAYSNNPDPLLAHIINECQSTFNAATHNTKPVECATIESKNFTVRQNLKAIIDSLTPEQFEKFSVDLLAHILSIDNPNSKITKTYTGKVADGGIDGEVMVESSLKSDNYAIQCKQYSKSVPVQSVREFIGVLGMSNYKHGYFVASSDFTSGGYNYEIEMNNLTLITGDRLVDFMLEYRFGVIMVELPPDFQVNTEYFKLL